jgi:hypothetical protein
MLAKQGIERTRQPGIVGDRLAIRQQAIEPGEGGDEWGLLMAVDQLAQRSVFAPFVQNSLLTEIAMEISGDSSPGPSERLATR